MTTSLDAAMAWKARKARVDRWKRAKRLQRGTDGAPPVGRDAEGILDFQVRISPQWRRADHFRLYAAKLELAIGNDLRVVFSAPPQHGKTEITLHALAWIALMHPGKRHAYITYNSKRTRSVARKFRRLLQAAGIAYTGSLEQIILPGGGQVLFATISAGITGEPVDGVAIIDDPFKDRKEADSATRREDVEMAYREAVETRVHPGASIFVLATRWHPKDLSGILIEEGWEYINLPAIAEENDPNGRAIGEALFPECRPLDFLLAKKRQLLDFSFSALYQGRPRPKGGKIFHEPNYYSALPIKNYRGGYGVDLAYTAKSSADWSICVELWREDRSAQKLEPLFYVVRVDRRQVEAPEFADLLEQRRATRKWGFLWRASGTEKGSAQFIKSNGIPLIVKQPPGDKLVSAQDVAAAWNDGRVLIPDREKFPDADQWLDAFLDIVQNFTGLGKEVDDDVDALGNAFDLLKSSDLGRTEKIGTSRWG